MLSRQSTIRVAPAPDEISNISDIENITRERRSIEVDDPDGLVTKTESPDQGSVVERIKIKSKLTFSLLIPFSLGCLIRLSCRCYRNYIILTF